MVTCHPNRLCFSFYQEHRPLYHGLRQGEHSMYHLTTESNYAEVVNMDFKLYSKLGHHHIMRQPLAITQIGHVSQIPTIIRRGVYHSSLEKFITFQITS